MKTVFYDEGPDRLTAGIAGELVRGVPKEIDDAAADALLSNPLFRLYEKPKREEDK